MHWRCCCMTCGTALYKLYKFVFCFCVVVLYPYRYILGLWQPDIGPYGGLLNVVVSLITVTWIHLTLNHPSFTLCSVFGLARWMDCLSLVGCICHLMIHEWRTPCGGVLFFASTCGSVTKPLWSACMATRGLIKGTFRLVYLIFNSKASSAIFFSILNIGWCTDVTCARVLQTVKKDEFSTKCNQTDHHRMPGGRQEVWDQPATRMDFCFTV